MFLYDRLRKYVEHSTYYKQHQIVNDKFENLSTLRVCSLHEIGDKSIGCDIG